MQLIALLLVLAAGTQAQEAAKPAFEATDSYFRLTIAGFDVRLSQATFAHGERTLEGLLLLKEKLTELTRIIPEKPLAELRKCPIWMEWEYGKYACMCYHPGAEWLRENGYNPDKTGSVEISNINNFIEWTRRDQPMMVLHELAHYYHHRVLGYGYEPLEEAYKAAKDSGTYDDVPYHRDEKRGKAYAMNNSTEYFSELTEAYFGKNDWFPLTHEDLKKHDPKGYALLEKVWGKPHNR